MKTYLEAIRYGRPELRIDSAECLGSGQNNDILLINKQIIFRFPKYEEGVRQLKWEVDLLNRIGDRVPIEVPRPGYHDFHLGMKRWTFISYHKIAGEPLEAELLHKIGEKQLLRYLAGQLGRFLKDLHRIDTTMIGKREMENVHREWTDMYERIQAKLYSYMTQEARRWVDHHFSSFLEQRVNFEIVLTLIHGDFGTSNILFDSIEQRISGIIDFGSAGIGDPAVDYAGLLASYGEGFFRLVMDQSPEVIGMMDRIAFYKGTFALQEALFVLENNDPEAFRNGMKDYI